MGLHRSVTQLRGEFTGRSRRNLSTSPGSLWGRRLLLLPVIAFVLLDILALCPCHVKHFPQIGCASRF